MLWKIIDNSLRQIKKILLYLIWNIFFILGVIIVKFSMIVKLL